MRLKILLLLIIPILFSSTSLFLKKTQGLYYLGMSDPSYMYLISSLNISQLNSVGHHDHPGIPVQLIGATAMRVYHYFDKTDPFIANDVLSRPETYLNFMHKAFTLINAISIFVFGLYVLRSTGNIFYALLLQFSPFASEENFYGFLIIAPENFMITVGLVFLSFIIHYLYKMESDKPDSWKYVLAFAAICGIGLATKVNFLPLLVIPLFLVNGIKAKGLLILCTVSFFLIFVLIFVMDIGFFLKWVANLFLHSERYGQGESSVLNISSMAGNVLLIFKKNIVFTIAYFGGILTLLIYHFSLLNKVKFSDYKINKNTTVLISVIIAMTLQILMVAKHYAQYYMIPSFMLSIIALIIEINLLFKIYEKHLKRIDMRWIFVLIILSMLVSRYFIVKHFYNVLTDIRKETLRIESFIKQNYSETLLIPSLPSSNQDAGLAMVTIFYGAKLSNKYQRILSEKCNSCIFFEPWIGGVYSFGKPEHRDELLRNSNNFLLQLKDSTSLNKFINSLMMNSENLNFKNRKVFENKYHEQVYEFYR